MQKRAYWFMNKVGVQRVLLTTVRMPNADLEKHIVWMELSVGRHRPGRPRTFKQGIEYGILAKMEWISRKGRRKYHSCRIPGIHNFANQESSQSSSLPIARIAPWIAP